MSELRKYGAATTVLFPLIDAGAIDFEATPVTFAAADTQISKDEGAFANTGSTPAHEGNGIYSLALTATEMQAARISIIVIDQTATKLWEDQAVIIDTYGNASAQHAFDLDSALQEVNLVQWGGVAPSVLIGNKVQVDVRTWLGAAVAALTGDLVNVDVEKWRDVIPDALTGGLVNADLERWRGSVPNVIQAGLIDAFITTTATGAIIPSSFFAGAINAAAIATGAIDADALKADAVEKIADAVLRRPTASVESGWTEDDRTLYGVVAALMHKHARDGSNITLYKSNDTDVLVTIPISTDAALDPISQIDPP